MGIFSIEKLKNVIMFLLIIVYLQVMIAIIGLFVWNVKMDIIVLTILACRILRVRTLRIYPIVNCIKNIFRII